MRAGNVGVLYFYINGGMQLTTSWQVVANLPIGVRPYEVHYTTAQNTMAYVAKDGTIGLKAVSGTADGAILVIPFVIA